MAQNMTKGNPTKLLVEFMIPVLIGNLFQNLYGIVDSMVVGRYLGVDALAAVGSVGIVTFGVQGLAIGMTSGFGIIFSQCYGGQKESELRHHICGCGIRVSYVFCVDDRNSPGISAAFAGAYEYPAGNLWRDRAVYPYFFLGLWSLCGL